MENEPAAWVFLSGRELHPKLLSLTETGCQEHGNHGRVRLRRIEFRVGTADGQHLPVR